MDSSQGIVNIPAAVFEEALDKQEVDEEEEEITDEEEEEEEEVCQLYLCFC